VLVALWRREPLAAAMVEVQQIPVSCIVINHLLYKRFGYCKSLYNAPYTFLPYVKGLTDLRTSVLSVVMINFWGNTMGQDLLHKKSIKGYNSLDAFVYYLI